MASRFTWVRDNLRNAATGLCYHAGYQPTNPAAVVPYHWLRAIGWFANFKASGDGINNYQNAAY